MRFRGIPVIGIFGNGTGTSGLGLSAVVSTQPLSGDTGRVMGVVLSEIAERSGVRFGTSGVRGLVEAMTDDICQAYTRAFLEIIKGKGGPSDLVVGHDLRPSSPRMAAACVAVAVNLGFRVRYAGVLPTPALAWYGQTIGAPVLVVTGSHIPFDRNGIKFYRPDGELSKADEDAMMQIPLDGGAVAEPIVLPDPERMAADAYVRRYVDFFGPGSLVGMRVAVFEHSSAARDILRVILEALGASVLSLGRTDSFVAIDTEAVSPEDIRVAHEWAKSLDFDAVVSTDGDGDRPLVGDESGNWFRGDTVGLLCSRFLGADHVVTPVSSNTALERSGWFRTVTRTRIGSPYVIAAMQGNMSVEGICAGYEANGGFLLGGSVFRKDRVLDPLLTRDAVLPIVTLLVASRERGCPMSALTVDLPRRFTASDRLQDVAPARSSALLERLQNNPEELSSCLPPDCGAVVLVDRTDGLRMTFASGDIVHLRPSGNAPELRCYTEAGMPDRAEELCHRCLGSLR